jgi:hypothetical protein
MTKLAVGDYVLVLVNTQHYKLKGDVVQVHTIRPGDQFPVFVKTIPAKDACNYYKYNELSLVTKKDNPEYFI